MLNLKKRTRKEKQQKTKKIPKQNKKLKKPQNKHNPPPKPNKNHPKLTNKKLCQLHCYTPCNMVNRDLPEKIEDIHGSIFRQICDYCE